MTGWDLLGILGEHFALLLGMSLASFVEIVELISLILLRSFGWMWKREKPKNNSIREKASLVKIASVPNAVRSHSKILSFIRLFVFLSFTSLSLYLVQGTVIHYLHYPVATEVKRETNLSTQVGFCNDNTFLTQYAFDLLTQHNFSLSDPDFDQFAAFYDIEYQLLQSRGYMLTLEELSRLSDINRTVISCCSPFS